MWAGRAGDQTVDVLISHQPATPPAPQMLYHDAKQLHV